MKSERKDSKESYIATSRLQKSTLSQGDQDPLVSVVVTVYNLAWCVKETIQSVLQQTYKNVEIIVVDDGSTDETAAQLATFGDRIITIRQRNKGFAGARNAGITRVRGEFVALLDGDDLWEPEKLAEQVAAARANPTSGLIVVDGFEFSHHDKRIIRKSLFIPDTRGIPEFIPLQELPEGAVYTVRLTSDPVPSCFVCTPSQVLMPTSVMKAIGLFDPRCKGACDLDFWVRVAADYDVTLIKRPLMRYRHYPTSSSGPAMIRDFRWARTSLLVLKKHLNRLSIDKKALVRQQIQDRIHCLAEAVYSHGQRQDRRWATHFLWQLLKENPTYPLAAVFLMGLWCPQWLTRRIGPSIRRVCRIELDP